MSEDSCKSMAEGGAMTPSGGGELQSLDSFKQSSKLVQGLRRLWESLRHTVVILGGAIIIFIAARNSITWQLQRVWGASGDYWQSQWQRIHDMTGGDPYTLGIWGSAIVGNTVFILFNLFFTFLDITGRPQFLVRYKIQPEKNAPVDNIRLRNVLLTVLFNQTVVAFPVIYTAITLMVWRGCDFGRELPTFHWVVFELAVSSLVLEIMFYYSHRLAHNPRLYKHIHKKHHEWTAPISWTSVYAHPIEHIVSNLSPPLMGPLLMGSHIATLWLWVALTLFSTTVSHCGYHLPLLPSPEAHDFHHLKFTNNFGAMGILDRLHGTDMMFRESRQYDRHVLLLNSEPLRQTFPDPSPRQLCKQKSE